MFEGETAVIEPPPPPCAHPLQTSRCRSAETIRPPQRIARRRPVYPPIAQAARVHRASSSSRPTIGVDGRVQDARVLRSAPLLDEAASPLCVSGLYTPTRLNGEPVSVVMTVTVNFQLQ